MIDPAFDIDAPVLKDDSVRNYQYYAYPATDPDIRSRIDIQIQDTSKYFLPCSAYIEVEGELIQADNTLYDANARVSFVNNGVMSLFESVRYLIDEENIELIERDVDVATTIISD
mgnify:CR=1 FL=1